MLYYLISDTMRS